MLLCANNLEQLSICFKEIALYTEIPKESGKNDEDESNECTEATQNTLEFIVEVANSLDPIASKIELSIRTKLTTYASNDFKKECSLIMKEELDGLNAIIQKYKTPDEREK